MIHSSGHIPGAGRAGWGLVFVALVSWLVGCGGEPDPPVSREQETRAFELKRTGDEIVAAGRYFHTGADVVLWTDPDGYDAYRTERRFGPVEDASWSRSRRDLSSPNRYNSRADRLPSEQRPSVRGGGWTLEQLREVVELFVIHYDATGSAETTFRVLHDQRGLSCHFMLGLDGTIYQTLDLKERAWHAGSVNSRSIGIEIANPGAYLVGEPSPTLERWYETGADGRTRLTLPGNHRLADIVPPLGPTPNAPVIGEIHGRRLIQYGYTEAQYRALAKLTAALHRIFPKIQVRAPRASDGAILDTTLEPEALAQFSGFVGHYHVAGYKIDPGPAFDWERLLSDTRARLREVE